MRRIAAAGCAGCLILSLVACGAAATSSAPPIPTQAPASTTASPTGPSPVPSPLPSDTPLPNADDVIEDVVVEEAEVAEQEVTAQDPAIFISDMRPGQPDPGLTRDYLAQVVAHLDRTWTAWFTSVNMAEPWVSYWVIMPGEEARSVCTDPHTGAETVADSTYNNAFYCGFDVNANPDGSTYLGSIYLPVDTMGQMWSGDIFDRQVSDLSRVGDFAAAMLVAHEFGHHVQDEITAQLGVPKPSGINSEQIADCFAGAWAYAVFAENYLEEGDIEEAISALGVIGDQNPLRSSHGTGAQRQNAFLVGYTGSMENPVPGVPANCIVGFWPEFMALFESQ